MKNRPFFLFGLFAFAAALCVLALPMWALVAIAGGLLISVAAVWLFPSFRSVRIVWSVASVAALLVGGLFLLKLFSQVYPLTALDGASAQVTVRVLAPASSEDSVIAEVETGDLPRGARLCLWLKIEETAVPGERLAGEVTLTAAMKTGEKDAYALSGGSYLYAWTEGEPLVDAGSGERSRLSDLIFTLQNRIRESLHDHMQSDAAGICQSVLLGDRSALSEATQRAFRNSGVYHLLAVSGLHLSVITGALLFLLRRMRCPRRLSSVLTMVGVLFFMMLCGFTPSVMRAGIMTLLMLAALLVYRRADGLNSLGAAALLMLVIDPFSAADIGMQLSFAASLGLLTLFPAWERGVTGRISTHRFWGACLRSAVSALGVSLCASAFTLPLTALYFGELSLLFLPANLLCVLPASAMLVLCALALLIGFIPYVGVIATPLFWLAQGLAGWLYGVTGFLSSLPFSALFHVPPYLVAWLFIAALFLFIAVKWRPKAGFKFVLCFLAGILPLASLCFGLLRSGVTTVTAVRGDSVSLLLETDGEYSAVFGGDQKALSSLADTAESHGVRRLKWLLWLNEGSAQSLDFSVFPWETEDLILPDPPEAYANLPKAEHRFTLEDDAFAQLSDRAIVNRIGDFYRLEDRETSLLIGLSGADAAQLKEEWRTPDVLLYQTLLPLHTDCLRIKVAVCFCTISDSDRMGDAPCGASSQWVAAKNSVSFMTKGRGDITRVWWDKQR